MLKAIFNLKKNEPCVNFAKGLSYKCSYKNIFCNVQLLKT